MSQFEVITAAATRSEKQRGNEDRVLTFGADRVGSGGVVLCDGVGATAGAAAAAEHYSTLAAKWLEGSQIGVWGLPGILQRPSAADQESGRTTLIALVAEPSGYVSYLLLGNGSVIGIAPTRLPAGGVRLLWSDLVLPHIDWSEGRPAVDSVLPAYPGGLSTVRGAQWVTDEARAYVVCSDGFATIEDRDEGEVSDGSIWRQVPVGLARLVDMLGKQWGALISVDAEEARRALAGLLDDLLDELVREPGIEDDTSVGVLLLRRTSSCGMAVPERAEAI